jgi:hypothetical protein
MFARAAHVNELASLRLRIMATVAGISLFPVRAGWIGKVFRTHFLNWLLRWIWECTVKEIVSTCGSKA